MIIEPNKKEGPFVIYIKDTNLSYMASVVRRICDFLQYSEITKYEILEDVTCSDVEHAMLVMEYHFGDYIAFIKE